MKWKLGRGPWNKIGLGCKIEFSTNGAGITQEFNIGIKRRPPNNSSGQHFRTNNARMTGCNTVEITTRKVNNKHLLDTAREALTLKRLVQRRVVYKFAMNGPPRNGNLTHYGQNRISCSGFSNNILPERGKSGETTWNKLWEILEWY